MSFAGSHGSRKSWDATYDQASGTPGVADCKGSFLYSWTNETVHECSVGEARFSDKLLEEEEAQAHQLMANRTPTFRAAQDIPRPREILPLAEKIVSLKKGKPILAKMRVNWLRKKRQ